MYTCILGYIQHPTNDTFCEGSNAMFNCVVIDNSDNDVASNTGWFRDEDPPGLVQPTMDMRFTMNNTRDGNVVTSILTIENVSSNDNSTGYFCVPAYGFGSYPGVISVAGEYFYLLCTYKCIYNINYV